MTNSEFHLCFPLTSQLNNITKSYRYKLCVMEKLKHAKSNDQWKYGFILFTNLFIIIKLLSLLFYVVIYNVKPEKELLKIKRPQVLHHSEDLDCGYVVETFSMSQQRYLLSTIRIATEYEAISNIRNTTPELCD